MQQNANIKCRVYFIGLPRIKIKPAKLLDHTLLYGSVSSMRCLFAKTKANLVKGNYSYLKIPVEHVVP